VATFPALEPNTRSYDITGELPLAIEQAWPAGQVRYRTGYAPLASVGLQVQLSYLDLRETQVQLLRDHYAFQQAGLVPFALPPVIFQGITGNVFPPGIQWRYTGTPLETQKKGGLFDVTVPLESMAYPVIDTTPAPVPPPPPSPVPISATYSQSSVWSANEAATAEGMTNGIFAETLETSTDGPNEFDDRDWVQMDFGSQTAFSRIFVGCDFDFTLIDGNGPVNTENSSIRASNVGGNDPADWTTLVADIGTFTQGIQEYATPGASYRYVRLVGREFDYLAVTELYASL
jgi:hypothetical protein